MKRLLFLLCAGLLTLSAAATTRHLLPRPQQITTNASATPFALQRMVRLTDPTNCAYLRRLLQETGCTLTTGAATAEVRVTLVSSIAQAYDYTLSGFENEAYTLNVASNLIEIKAITPTGVIRAAQTLWQLCEADTEGWASSVEAVQIVDWPAFKLRGMMHDVGRSWVEFETLKRQIDLMARFKVNVFHWHLTENQAWRFEVKRYPALTQASSMTRFAGKYYTQAQCTELEQYAAERGVIVIPEIDMPGHSEAFARAMGHDMQTAQGVLELQYILEEVAQVFPLAPYIHIGADEKAITYTNFIQTMTAKLHALGKKVVVWNPISGVSINPTTLGIDMTQMWSSGGKKIAGVPNIDCRYNYTNHFDVFADLVGIFKSNIYYEQRGNAEVAGFISAPWNDRKTPTETDIIAQNNVYAVTIACTERAWRGGGKQYIEKGGTMLPNEGEEYEEFADWEARFLWHKAHCLKDEPIPYVKQTNVRWRLTEPFPNGSNAATSLPPETQGPAMEYEYNGTTYGTKVVTGAGIYLRHTWGGTVPSHYASASTGTTAYAWTYVYSPVAQTVGAQIEFQNYGRSEKDSAPDAGCWDRKGSKIYLNGAEILPPVWQNTGRSINNEVDLRNENFPARNPIPVALNAGWNYVLVKLPYMNASGVRLNKWLWTFVLTDLEGKNAVEGLVYSPSKSLTDENFESTFAGGGVRPTLSTLDAPKYYYMQTPLRQGRYVKSDGAGQNVVSSTAKEAAAAWALINRGDGTFDVYNYADHIYLSPSATYNTAIKGVTARPTKGWSLANGDTEGFYIVTSGSVQLNQTTLGPSYPVYNWGNGTNTSDQGCQFLFQEAKEYNGGEIPEPDDHTPKTSTAAAPFYYFISAPLRGGRYITSQGAGANITTSTGAGYSAAWALLSRGDGTFDLRCYADNTYLTPNGTKGGRIQGVSTQPASGWTLGQAATDGYFTIISGTSQVNQSNAGQNYDIFNWGDGTNTSDTGCQFQFVEATEVNRITSLDLLQAAAGEEARYDLQGRRLQPAFRPQHGVYIERGRKRVY